MPRYREWDLACKVYVGNLGSSASKYEIENAFSKYGPLRNVWVARNPPGFAFVEFEDKRDAEDATRGLDGTRCCGTRIRVEMSSGRSRRDNRRRGGTSSGGGRGGGGESSSGGRGGGGRYRKKTTSASTTTSTRTTSTTTTNSSSYYYFYNKPINNFNNNDYNFYYCYNNRNNFTKTVIPFIKITNTINKNNTKQYSRNSNNYTTLAKLKSNDRNYSSFISLVVRSSKKNYNNNNHLLDISIIKYSFKLFNIYHHYHDIKICSTQTFLGKLLKFGVNVVVVVVVCKQYHQILKSHQTQYHQHNQKYLYNCSRFLQRNCCNTYKSSTSSLTILYSPSSATSTSNASTSVAIRRSTKTTTKNIKTITKTTTSAITTTTTNISNINSSPFNNSKKIINTTTSITFTKTIISTIKTFSSQLALLLVLQMLQYNAVCYWSSTAASVGFLACLSFPNNISTTQLAAVFFQHQLYHLHFYKQPQSPLLALINIIFTNTLEKKRTLQQVFQNPIK